MYQSDSGQSVAASDRARETSTTTHKEVIGVFPEHYQGTVYYAQLGCKHPDCLKAAAGKKAAQRAKRRSERVYVSGRWVHPRLAPVSSTVPARHGTVYGRREYGCECPPCMSDPPQFPYLSIAPV